MCLVMDPALLGDAIRILPFDSGGYDRYPQNIGPLLKRPDFELGARREIPMRLVKAFYQTNRNYYVQSPTADHDAIPIRDIRSSWWLWIILEPQSAGGRFMWGARRRMSMPRPLDASRNILAWRIRSAADVTGRHACGLR